MAAMKRLEVECIERARAKYRRMDALQVEVVVAAAATAAFNKVWQHLPQGGQSSDRLYSDLYSFIEGRLEHLYGE